MEGGSVILILDLKSKEIKMRVCDDTENAEDAVLWRDIPTGPNIEYKLAVGIYIVGDSITVCHHDGH